MIHQIGRKLRQQIHYFSGELCKGMGAVASRFVEEAVFGLSASGSVRLTEIGRALGRLSRFEKKCCIFKLLWRQPLQKSPLLFKTKPDFALQAGFQSRLLISCRFLSEPLRELPAFLR